MVGKGEAMAGKVTFPKAFQLKMVVDERGWVMVGPSTADFKIDYAYATCCLPGAVKGWHRHAKHEDRLWCVSGLARVAVAREQASLWDRVPNGEWDVMEWTVGPLNPRLVVVPPGWWHAFAAVGGEPCVVANCPDRPWDPGDQDHMALGEVPFEW